jgi:hypothetical protein
MKFGLVTRGVYCINLIPQAITVSTKIFKGRRLPPDEFGGFSEAKNNGH